MTVQRILISLIVAAAIISSPGCVYRMDVLQGNRIDADTLAQLRLGMSTAQVEFLMGSPAVIDLYRPDRWHYVYYQKSGDDGAVEQRNLLLTFKDDLLAAIDGAQSLE